MSTTHGSLVHRLLGSLGKHTRPTGHGWVNYCHKKCADKKFRLGVHLRKGRYRCFNCGAAGDLDDLLPGLKAGESFVLPINDPEKAPPPAVTALPWRPITAPGTEPTSTCKRALAYLAGRGIPHAHAHRLGLGYGIEGPWAERVIHPYYWPGGRLGGWQGRLMYDPDEDDPTRKVRFAVARDMPKGERILTPNMGALYLAERLRPGEPALVVEGPYDAIHAERAIQSTGLFGSRMSPAQVTRLCSKRPSAIYVGLDRDKSGRHWNKDSGRWEPDPRLAIARALYVRSRAPVYVIQYPDTFEGDFGGDEDKHPHPTEELTALLSAAVRFRPGVRL